MIYSPAHYKENRSDLIFEIIKDHSFATIITQSEDTVFGYFLFHEKLTPTIIIGGLLIMLSLVLGNWPKKIMREIPE